MRDVLAALLAVGCGHRGFATGDAGAAGDEGAACEPRPEICNGIDDDCNGAIDEGCPCTPFDVTLPMPALDANLVWTGTGYLTLFDDGTNTLVTEIGPSGAIGASAILAPDAMLIGKSSFGWAGSTLVVAWTDTSFELRGTMFGPGLTPVGSPSDLGPSSSADPAITAVGDRFALAFYDNNLQSYLREIDTLARPVAGLHVLSVPGEVQAIARAEAGYVIGTGGTGMTTLRALLIDRNGVVQRTTDLATIITGRRDLQVVAGPDGFGALWLDGDALMFQRLDRDALPIGSSIMIPSSNQVGYVVALLAARTDGYEIIASRADFSSFDYVELDRAGNVVAGPVSFAAFNAVVIRSQMMVTADHREALAFTFDSPAQLRIIQMCR